MASESVESAAAQLRAEAKKKDCKNCKWTYPDEDSGSSSPGNRQRGGINTDAARKSGLMRCPPDYHELGRHTWTYLHSLAMYYPEEPTEALKEDMETHLDTFSRLYPCSPCAVHMREYTKENPFELDSRLKFSLWMCNFHNDVNRLQRKPLFDCRRLVDRWGLPPPKQCLLERQAAYDLFVDHDDEELDADLGDFVDDEDEVDDDDELYA